MGRKMSSEQFWQGEAGSTISGVLGQTTRTKTDKETGEVKTEPAWSVTDDGGITWIMPDHYSLDNMLQKNCKIGDRVTLIYHGTVGPKARGKNMAVWTGTIDDEK